MDNTTSSWQRILVTILVLMGLLYLYNFVTNRSAYVRQITVVGNGSKIVAAKEAKITFTVSVTNSDRTQAFLGGEERYLIVSSGLATYNPTEVRTITPQIVQDTQGRYQYVAGAQITIADVAKVKDLATFLAQNGATVAQVRYVSDNEDQIEKEVQELAIADAKKKAADIAGPAGAKIGDVLSIAEQGSNAQTGSAVTQVNTIVGPNAGNDIEIISAISVVFALRPRFIFF